MRAIFSATRSLAFIALAATLASDASSAQEAHRTARMSFKDGRASVSGQIRGYDFVDYVFSAGASESIEVEMKTANTATYFNLLAPGEKETSFFTGSTSGMRFAGPAPASGDYTARVYMMRSAARRGERAAYRLTVVLGGTRLTGGIGRVEKTIIGAFILFMTLNWMTIRRIPTEWQQAATGLLVLAAILIDRLAQRGRAS